MLNEKTAAVLEGLTEERGIDWNSLSEENHPVHVAKGIDALRRWLQIPGTTGGLRPSDDVLSVILGYGREGCLRIYRAYVEETARTTEEATVILGALETVARKARAMRLIVWDLSGLTVEAAKGNPKLLVALPEEVDSRLRTAAAARGETLTGFVVEAIRDRLARIEKPRRAAAVEGETATAAT